jgi:alkylation response protein AidB-like acyl-CoA dehydrogenase
MRFALSDEQTMLGDSLARALSEVVDLPLLQALNRNPQQDTAQVSDALTQIGLPGLLIDEDHGGIGLGLIEAAVCAEALGTRVAPAPFTGTAVMAPLAIQACTDTAIQQTWLPALASGEKRIAVGLSDWAAGTRKDTGLKVVAGKLSGTTRLVLDADRPNAFLVADREGQLYLVAADAIGLSLEAFRTIDVTRRTAVLKLSGVNATPLADVYGEALTRIVDAGRVVLAADTLGASHAMLQQAVDYAAERRQFGRTISSFQAVKHLCAEMAAQIQPCRAMVWYTAYAFDSLGADEFALNAALTKSHLDETGRFVARTATEVHGGMGFTDLQGLHYWFKRIGFNGAALGSPAKLRQRAAQLQGLVPDTARR